MQQIIFYGNSNHKVSKHFMQSSIYKLMKILNMRVKFLKH